MTGPQSSIARLPDRRGVATTTADPAAVEALDRAVRGLAAHRADTAAHVAHALELDPDLVVAHVLAGFAAKLLGRSDLEPAARASAERARTAIARRGATEREERLCRALERWCARDAESAVAELDALLAREPLDLLAVKLAHALHFLLGRTAGMRASIEHVLPAWERAGADGLGPVLGCHAFALEESGEFARAEAVGRRALALDPIDPWGAHAVAHVLHTTGRPAEGLAWIESIARCLEGANNFAGHVHWHRCLLLVVLGRAEETLAIHDRAIAIHLGRDYRDLVNSATLLYRLERVGVDVGDRWTALADLARARIGDHALAFADAHYVLALAGAGESELADRFVSSMRETAAGRQGIEAEIALEVGLPVARALAIARRDPARARDLLKRHQDDLSRLGGSRAQREIFGLVLADCAIARREPSQRRAAGA